MTFEFIVGDVGPKERRRIRAHVMVGKNVGKARPSRKHQPIARSKQSIVVNATTRLNHEEMGKCRLRGPKCPLLYDRLICNDLAFTQASKQSATSAELLRQWLILLDRRLYPAEFCSKLDFMDYVWVQYAFYDEGYMHGVLAIKTSFSESLGMYAETSASGLAHLSKAYQITQKRLDGPKASSDTAIAGVTILAIYQLVHGHVEIGLVHFAGLCRMVQLRGGLAKLMKHNRALAQKPWRIDLEFALRSGLPLRFGATEIPVNFSMIKTRLLSPIHTELYEGGVKAELIGILSDVTAFTNSLNTIDEARRLDPLDFSEQAFSIIHRLIDFAPLHLSRPSNSTENLLQLALLAVMTTSLPNYTIDERRYELLARELKAAIQCHVMSIDAHWEFLLWAVFVGHVSILHGTHNTWIFPTILEILQHLDIESWAQVRRTLGRYCWIYVTHDTLAMKIWEKVKALEEVNKQ